MGLHMLLYVRMYSLRVLPFETGVTVLLRLAANFESS